LRPAPASEPVFAHPPEPENAEANEPMSAARRVIKRGIRLLAIEMFEPRRSIF
jgi:hypothetical protein